MNRVLPNANAGFTLVEILVGATLSAVVMAAVLSSYIFIGRNLGRLANQQTLESESRRTLAYFNQDVRMTSGFTNAPTATAVTLNLPSATGTNAVTYYYNNNDAETTVSLSGSSVIMAPRALTRCVYNGTTLTSQILLRNIIDTDGCYFRYYDGSGNAYDNGTSPYTTSTAYNAGIKQISLQFNIQAGVDSNGTQTRIYKVSSNRLVIRNRALLE